MLWEELDMTSHLTRRSALALSAAGAATLAMPALGQSKTRITVVTGGTGGVFYPYGGGIAKILSDKMPNTQATAQVTGGSVDNVKLLAAGDAELGFTTLDSAFDGLQGIGAYAKDGKQDVRLLALLYDSFLHIVTPANSGFTSIASLKGKRVGVGSAGSSTESIADRVIEAAGLNPKTDITRDNLGVAESANALKDGKISAFFWIGGIPTAAVRDLATTAAPAISFIPSSAEVAKLDAQFKGIYRPFPLPANSYAGQTTEIAGLGVPNALIVSAKAPAALITAIMEGLFGNLDDVQKVHPEARKLNLKSAAARTAVPLHPAAEAYYKAKGALT
jgi:uncharacterized protein